MPVWLLLLLLLLQVFTVLQPLMTNDPPPTYFKTDMFTNCFQV